MKKNYIAPRAEVSNFEIQSIICTSAEPSKGDIKVVPGKTTYDVW